MAVATIQVNPQDSTDDVTIADGAAVQSKALMIVVDDSLVDVTDTLAITTMLRNAAAAIRRDTPIATS